MGWVGVEGSADSHRIKISKKTSRAKTKLCQSLNTGQFYTCSFMWHGNEKLFCSRSIIKYPIIVFSSWYKRFWKLDLLTALGDWSRRKSRTPPPYMLGNSLAELAVLPGKYALVLFLSGLLFLHQIIKLDTINQSHLSLGVGIALCCVLSQDITWKSRLYLQLWWFSVLPHQRNVLELPREWRREFGILSRGKHWWVHSIYSKFILPVFPSTIPQN